MKMASGESGTIDRPSYSPKFSSENIKAYSRRHKYRNSTQSKVIAQSNMINQMTAEDSQSQDFPSAEWQSFLSTIKSLTSAEKKPLRPQLCAELKRTQLLIEKIKAREQELIQCRQISEPDACWSPSIFSSKASAMQLQYEDNVEMPTLKRGSKRTLQQSRNALWTAKWPRLDAAKHPKSDENAKLRASLMSQCATILKRLESHEFSWIFLQPVDAVKLNLPDYHQIISDPMDLGTIKKKLQNKVYTSPLQFAADVRLTFANAMKYNPEEQDGHKMAYVLSQLFESRWRLLSKKLERLALTDDRTADCDNNEVEVVIPNRLLSPTIPWRHTNKTDSRRSIAVKFPRKPNSRHTNKTAFAPVRHTNKTDPIAVKFPWKPISRPVCESRTPGVISPTKPNEKHRSRQPGDFEDEDVDIGDNVPVTSFPPVIIDRDGSLTDFSSSDSSSSSSDSSDSDSSSSDSSSSSSDSDSDNELGADSAQDSCSLTETLPGKESLCDEPRANTAITIEGSKRPLSPISEEALSTSPKGGVVEQDHQVPPERLVRAALLKGRFADTILKAQEELLSHKSTGADPEKLRRERDELQRKERARLQAEAEAAAASKERLQRESERQAARQALQQMEMAIEPPVNFDLWEDLDSSGSNFQLGLDSKLSCLRPGNPLEQLRLLMKEDKEKFFT